MVSDKIKALETILDALFIPYKNSVPDVLKVTNGMVSEGIITNEREIINDHIAFRTLGVPHLGVSSFEKIFLHYGYKKKDYYFFEGKKLDGYWYAPPADHLPRIFMSELRVKDLSDKTQQIIYRYTQHITTDPVDTLDLEDTEAVGSFFHKALWDLPTLPDYLALADESEYAAWVIYNRYYLNHYTISVHDLPNNYNTVEKFNVFLEGLGIKLNTAGGKIKVSPDGLLKQSSTVAKTFEAEFANGEIYEISGSYVEFAERLPLKEFTDKGLTTFTRNQRRDGFESANADKIFESTYKEQTKK
ncbi:DUF1338 domain-containing protein [Cellulophaga sp. E16_2]|uniref:2-oxoadipate dioxygenase/decarboxylase n=1 Tax=Cellulophaga algicola (strain DSM 14237 / IC166 / ACAM 630) TaxID=688270 RepID=E6X421_CELAD|nr:MULTISPECIES: DUF1338 domain-containing protein [Cellulophaga]ADV50363.1 hypothetical protein Celal_3089 [Cellulophaga algicola DSM 14237]MBO0592767.1 DUF1338 domain-containing protein [Cellulophaga sp. E16_2]